MNGHDVKLSDFKGKALLINFWSTTCGPCQLETPELVDLAAKYKDRGFAIVGISIDDTPTDIRTFANQYRCRAPLLVGADTRSRSRRHSSLKDAVPMSVFVTAKGTVLGRVEGLATQSWMERQIQSCSTTAWSFPRRHGRSGRNHLKFARTATEHPVPVVFACHACQSGDSCLNHILQGSICLILSASFVAVAYCGDLPHHPVPPAALAPFVQHQPRQLRWAACAEVQQGVELRHEQAADPG